MSDFILKDEINKYFSDIFKKYNFEFVSYAVDKENFGNSCTLYKNNNIYVNINTDRGEILIGISSIQMKSSTFGLKLLFEYLGIDKNDLKRCEFDEGIEDYGERQRKQLENYSVLATKYFPKILSLFKASDYFANREKLVEYTRKRSEEMLKGL
ncbi:MAG: hypothetical protein HQL30_07135 [Candidatus Omnitrophica bacterium]|nr:hypothetical protein [Candidatus Omnitrophota bacterium]